MVAWLTGISGSYFTESIFYTSGGYGGAGYYNGNISKVSYNYSGNVYDYVFKYDNLNQLVVADHSANANGDMGVGQENKYDANGNFWSVKIGLATKNYTYHANTNRVKNTDGTLNAHYTYDNIGNVTASVPKSINSLTYDPFVNRTKTITMSGGNNMNFSYDGTEPFGKLTAGSVEASRSDDESPSVTTEILYLHLNAIVERNKTGTPTEYIYGPTGIIAIKTPCALRVDRAPKSVSLSGRFHPWNEARTCRGAK